MSEAKPRYYVWDVATRLFHWLLVGLFAFSWWAAENHEMEWHRWSGYVVSGLLLFRILWGLFGTSTARFAQFVKGPRAIIAYLRPGEQAAPEKPGHNPLGALSVIAILLALIVQVVTGLFAVDVDGLESGPFSYLVDFDQGRTAAGIHHTSFNLMLALIGLHILAILYYQFVRRQNLIGAMITGFRRGEGESAKPAKYWLLAIAVAAGLGLTWWLSTQSVY